MSKSRRQKIGTSKDPKQVPETTEIENTGNYLRTLRLGKGLSIKDVTESTRISETNLKAIEDQDFSSLPANTFTRGLLNIYANFLGAESETVIAKFMGERENASLQKRRSRPKKSRKILKPKLLAEPSHISSMTMSGTLFLLIVITFTGYCLYTSWNPFTFLIEGKRDIQSAMKSVFPEEQAAAPVSPAGEELPVSPSGEELITVPANKFSLEIMAVPQPAQEAEEVSSSSVVATAKNSKGDNEPQESITTSIDVEETTVAPKTDLLETKYTVKIRFLKDTSITMTRDKEATVENKFRAGDIQSWTADSSLTMTFSRPHSASILVNNAAVAFPEKQDGNYTLHIPQDRAEPHLDE